MNRVIWLLFCLFTTIACTPKEESFVPDDTAVTDETTVDQTMPDEVTVTDDEALPVDEPVNDQQPDPTDQTILPDEEPDTTVDTDVDIPLAEGAYQQCDPGTVGSCPEGLSCVKGYDNALYGQCLKGCAVNEDCPPPPDPVTMQVACHQTEKVCLILCGAYQSECPAWLECFGQEMCLPPSSVTATKGPGEICAGKDECLGEADCIEGSSGIPHCFPLCDPNVPNDCADKAPGFQAQCTSAGAFYFCMFTCQGVPCPGDLTCQAGVFCQG